MKKISGFILPAFCLYMLSACGVKTRQNIEETSVPRASVSTTTPVLGSIEERISLNGRTVFIDKNVVASPISGYLSAVFIQYGNRVESGQVLFEIQTPENKALQGSQSGNNPNNLGKIRVQATISGVVNEPVVLGKGAYVTEGGPLCVIADNHSLLVQVNVPYEYHTYVPLGTDCQLSLPDHTQSSGRVYRIRPVVDTNSQTQEVLVKPGGSPAWPENMNLTVSFIKGIHHETLLLPKKALLTNETMDEFWVMKVVRDSVAVRIPVSIGIQKDSLIEIITPDLTPEDIIILEGGYGLQDSSLVNILK